MSLPELVRRLIFLVQRRKRLSELDEELRFHQQLRAESFRAEGMPPDSAARAARRQFGNRTAWKESAWDAWAFGSLESVWRDARYGARVLAADWSFTALAILTLALGIGGATVMFSVIDNVLLEPFPYAQQARLFSPVIHDRSSNDAGSRSMFPASEFLDYREQNHVFEDVMGVGINRAFWRTGGTPESVNAPLVTANTFAFLGVPPLLGRLPSPTEATGSEASPVCVMSYAFGKSRFAGDKNIIGKSLTLDNLPRTVVAVMPPRFVFWSGDVWLPLALHRSPVLDPPWFSMLGRLKAGVSPNAAASLLNLLAQQLAKRYRPNLYTNHFDVSLQSFADASVGKFRSTLFTLLAVVGFVLAIACANVANLLLARATGRLREFAIRTSLGAGWWRVVRQLFLESALLAFGGAAVGCGFAWAGLKLLVAALPADTFPDEAVIALNGRVLLGTVAVAVATALFFGLIPVLGGLRRDTNDTLKSSGREHSDFRRTRLRNLLVAGEVAMSLVLLCDAGVLLRSFLRERAVPLGLNPERLLTAQVFTKGNRTVQRQAQYNRQLIAAVRALPGVLDAATTTDLLPFSGATTELALPAETPAPQSQGRFALTDSHLLHTLGVPLQRGRNLSEADLVAHHQVALVNQALADKFFRGQDPIGRQIEVHTVAHLPEPSRNASFEIVGVIANVKNWGLREPVLPETYLPNTLAALGGFCVVVHTAGDPASIGKQLEGIALGLDASTVVRRIRSLPQALESEEYAKPRFGLQIFAVFSAVGILLVSVGLYSVMSYTVTQRRREMGIRLALGATLTQVQLLVIRTGLRSILAGILAGLLLSLASLRLLQSQIWAVGPYDPAVLGIATAALIAIGLGACYLPSLAAARVNTAAVLRSE